MAAPEPKEEIVIKLDGKVVPLESLPPELKADVERRIKEGREAYAAKYPAGKLRMNINVKVKTSKEALKAAAAAGEKPVKAAVAVDDGGAPWFLIAVVMITALAAAYMFVPAFSAAVDKALDASRRAPTSRP